MGVLEGEPVGLRDPEPGGPWASLTRGCIERPLAQGSGSQLTSPSEGPREPPCLCSSCT